MRSATHFRYAAAAVTLAIAGILLIPGARPDKPEALRPPAAAGRMLLEEAIRLRRSVRQFDDQTLTLEQIGQLCWAGQGITDTRHGLRAAPSAGALYPIELYVVTPEGVDHYRPEGHALEHHLTGDMRDRLRQAGLDQESVRQAPVCIVISAVVERTAAKYERRADRYCLLEAGHVAQNILLQATALKLGGVPIGGFDDDKTAEALELPGDHHVLYLLPIGHPQK